MDGGGAGNGRAVVRPSIQLIREVPGSSVDARPTESAMQSALDECIRALTLAPTHDPNADEYGARTFLAILIDAPGMLERAELGLLIALVQRIALRRKWMVVER